MATRKSTPQNYNNGSVVSPSLPQPTGVTPQQLEEKRKKGICYNCDSKYTKGHKCAEKKLFYIEYEEEEEKDKKRRGYAPGPNPRERRNESDHIL